MTAGSEWEGPLGQKWAAEWRRTDRSFGMLTERLLQLSRDVAFAQVLDIGCGAGELSLALARGRPQVRVRGVDISPDLARVASERAHNLNNVDFEVVDASTWRPAATFRPELLISRHGVMFFPDPVAAFSNLRDLAAENATLMFSCFRDKRENPWISDLARQLPPSAVPASPPDPRLPGPFAFGDRDYVRSILEGAGWRSVAFEAYDFGMVAGAGEDAVEDATSYFLSIGPAAAATRDLGESERAAFGDRMRSFLESRLVDGIIVLRAAAWIVTARKGAE